MIISSSVLYGILLEAKSKMLDEYYTKHGNSIYRDTLILIRATYYEPLLEENFTDEYYKQYCDYFVKNNKDKIPPLKENVFPKSILKTFLSRKNKDLSEALSKLNLEYFHDHYLNESIHERPIVTIQEFSRCYIALQNLGVILNPKYIDYQNHIFKNEQEITKFLLSNKKYKYLIIGLTIILLLTSIFILFTRPKDISIPPKLPAGIDSTFNKTNQKDTSKTEQKSSDSLRNQNLPSSGINSAVGHSPKVKPKEGTGSIIIGSKNTIKDGIFNTGNNVKFIKEDEKNGSGKDTTK